MYSWNRELYRASWIVLCLFLAPMLGEGLKKAEKQSQNGGYGFDIVLPSEQEKEQIRLPHRPFWDFDSDFLSTRETDYDWYDVPSAIGGPNVTNPAADHLIHRRQFLLDPKWIVLPQTKKDHSVFIVDLPPLPEIQEESKDSR